MSKTSSIVKDSVYIYIELSRIKEELGLSNKDISKDAEKHGINLPVPCLSKYFSRSPSNNLPEHAILWLCERYCIKVSLLVEKQPYKESEALLQIKAKSLIK